MNENRISPRMPDLPADAERAKPNGAMDPAGEAGWFLMRERLDRGLSLEQTSDIVGIHPYHLEAIELGNMTNMPSRAEALEMIAAYANFLGFEPEPLLEYYISFLPAPQVAPRRHPANPAPMSSAKVLPFGRFVKLPTLNIKLPSIAAQMSKLPNVGNLNNLTNGNGGIVASVIGAFVVFSAVTWALVPGGTPAQPAEQMAMTEQSDPMPTASTGAEAGDVKITEKPMDGDLEATAEVQEPAMIPAPPALEDDVLGAFIKDNVAGGVEKQTELQTAEASPTGRVFGSPDAKVRLELKANRSIWLLIEDGKGNRVATQLLNKGDIFRVPNKAGLVATVQDGGAISYVIDGVEKGILGQPGAVLAAESLDIKKLEGRV